MASRAKHLPLSLRVLQLDLKQVRWRRQGAQREEPQLGEGRNAQERPVLPEQQGRPGLASGQQRRVSLQREEVERKVEVPQLR